MEADIPNANMTYPLHLACKQGLPEIAGYLLAKGADPNRVDQKGLTPFLISAIHTQDGTTRRQLFDFLEAAGADLNAQDHRGIGALHVSALRGDKPLLSWMVKR